MIKALIVIMWQIVNYQSLLILLEKTMLKNRCQSTDTDPFKTRHVEEHKPIYKKIHSGMQLHRNKEVKPWATGVSIDTAHKLDTDWILFSIIYLTQKSKCFIFCPKLLNCLFFLKGFSTFHTISEFHSLLLKWSAC